MQLLYVVGALWTLLSSLDLSAIQPLLNSEEPCFPATEDEETFYPAPTDIFEYQPKLWWSLTDVQYLFCVRCIHLSEPHFALLLSAPQAKDAGILCAPFPPKRVGNWWGIHYWSAQTSECAYPFVPRLYTGYSVDPKKGTGSYLSYKSLS